MDPVRFKKGDRVRLNEPADVTAPHQPSQGVSPWVVMGEDTNQTPTIDLEPAYELVRVFPPKVVRYAYQSCLRPAILGATGNE